MFVFWLIMFIFVGLISWIWVRGIDNMKRNHPDYKGHDFLDWDANEEDKQQIL